MCTKDIEMVSSKTDQQKKYVLEKIRTFLNYATRKYGCEFPKKFAHNLYEVAYEKRVPDEKVIDALVRAWNIWEPYVAKDSFQNFMEKGIISVFKNHSTNICHSPVLKGYIGNSATVIKALPAPLSTSITIKGELIKNGTRVV